MRLIGRAAEGLAAAGDERQREDVPDGDVAGPDQQRQRERRERLHVLRAGEQPPPIVPIGDDAANQHEEQDGQLAEEVVHPQVELRLGQVVDEQALGVLLHPGADGRAERGKPQQPVIAMGQGAGDAAPPRAWRFRFKLTGDGRGHRPRHLSTGRFRPSSLGAILLFCNQIARYHLRGLSRLHFRLLIALMRLFILGVPLGESKAKMSSPAVQLLETLLQHKKFAGTLARPREATRVAASGIDALDQRIGGGWPLGAISEVVGARSSGRTACWCPRWRGRRQGSGGGARGRAGSFRSALGGRRGTRSVAGAVDSWAPITIEIARPAVIDHAIRQAVRAFDLVIRAGGFAVVALDLGDIPPRRLQALPAVTWLRLAHANEGRDTAGLLDE